MRPRASNPDWLPIGPFRAWLDAYEHEHGQFALVCVVSNATDARYDVARRKIDRWRDQSQHVHVDTVDRVCLHADGPDLLRDLYPVREAVLA